MGISSRIDVDRVACNQVGVDRNRAGSFRCNRTSIQGAGDCRHPCSGAVDGNVAIGCIDRFGADSG